MRRLPDMSSHALFIASAYAITALVVVGLILRAVVDHRIQRRALAELEARGAGRRSRRG
ncbi:heme exporter protein CcmD [Microvirga puerhi]